MNYRMSAKQVVLLLFIAAAIALGSYLLGRRSSPEADARIAAESMATFMSAYSALAYLDKGDSRSAMLMLRDLADRNLITVHELGNPELERSRPGATSKWFSQYATLRKKLPSHSPSVGGEEFEREVENILAAAVKDASQSPKKQ